MKAVIVTGDRHAAHDEWWRCVEGALLDTIRDSLLVIHGNAPGIDAIAHRVCDHWRGMVAIPVPAQWDAHGKAAGPRRNLAMLTILQLLGQHGYGVEVLAFHDDLANSKGTGHMVRIARDQGIAVRHFTSDGKEAA